MTEVVPTPAAPVAPAPEPAVTPSAGTQVPAGYVPQAELDAVEARRRGFQAEADQAKSELAALRAASTPAAAPADVTPGAPTATAFDAQAFRTSLLTDVVTVTRLANVAETLKTKYPHAVTADPTIFDRVASFGSPEALEEVVKAAHDRVQTALDAAVAPEAVAARQAQAAAAAGAVAPPAGAAGTTAGDPTLAQIASWSLQELGLFKAANPGVIERVLRSA